MPDVGDFGVTATGGWVAKVIRLVCRSTVNHAFVYVGDGKIVEAQPGGAALSPVSNYPDAIWSTRKLDATTRFKIAAAATACVGRPYNFVDIAAQFLVRVFGWRAPQWALYRLSEPSHLQCAQLVDYCYFVCGVDLFDDSRPAGLVAPSDLLELIERG